MSFGSVTIQIFIQNIYYFKNECCQAQIIFSNCQNKASVNFLVLLWNSLSFHKVNTTPHGQSDGCLRFRSEVDIALTKLACSSHFYLLFVSFLKLSIRWSHDKQSLKKQSSN